MATAAWKIRLIFFHTHRGLPFARRLNRQLKVKPPKFRIAQCRKQMQHGSKCFAAVNCNITKIRLSFLEMKKIVMLQEYIFSFKRKKS